MSLIRNLRASTVSRAPVAFGAGFARTKATLAPLDYDFGALEPHISGQINELHYTKHHQTYVNNYNNFSEQYAEAVKTNDVKGQVALLPLINFNGGGFINHNLWWKNLAPQKEGGGEPPSADSKLSSNIVNQFGSLDKLKSTFNAKLAGIQGSGWGWLVKNQVTGNLSIITTANQDIVPAGYTPIIGIDAWEHAYYLQYKNVKADYFTNIWNVINWQEAVKRFDN